MDRLGVGHGQDDDGIWTLLQTFPELSEISTSRFRHLCRPIPQLEPSEAQLLNYSQSESQELIFFKNLVFVAAEIKNVDLFLKECQKMMSGQILYNRFFQSVQKCLEFIRICMNVENGHKLLVTCLEKSGNEKIAGILMNTWKVTNAFDTEWIEKGSSPTSFLMIPKLPDSMNPNLLTTVHLTCVKLKSEFPRLLSPCVNLKTIHLHKFKIIDSVSFSVRIKLPHLKQLYVHQIRNLPLKTLNNEQIRLHDLVGIDMRSLVFIHSRLVPMKFHVTVIVDGWTLIDSDPNSRSIIFQPPVDINSLMSNAFQDITRFQLRNIPLPDNLYFTRLTSLKLHDVEFPSFMEFLAKCVFLRDLSVSCGQLGSGILDVSVLPKSLRNLAVNTAVLRCSTNGSLGSSIPTFNLHRLVLRNVILQDDKLLNHFMTIFKFKRLAVMRGTALRPGAPTDSTIQSTLKSLLSSQFDTKWIFVDGFNVTSLPKSVINTPEAVYGSFILEKGNSIWTCTKIPSQKERKLMEFQLFGLAAFWTESAFLKLNSISN